MKTNDGPISCKAGLSGYDPAFSLIPGSKWGFSAPEMNFWAFRIPVLLLVFLFPLLFLSSCSIRQKDVVGRYGLSFIQLGDELPPAGIKRFKGHPVYDSLLDEGEYSWRASCLEYRKGVVYLEEDFYGSGLLSRIRIATPEIRLKNGLTIGKTLRELTETSDEWFILPLEQYRMFDFYSRLYPRIHFIIEDPNVPIQMPEDQVHEVSQFNPEVKIRWIVVL